MAKPTLPTQQEMRDYCRANYGHYSNLSREWLIQRTSESERIATYGYAEINRDMAEVWEADFFTKPVADQDVLLDWYINWYRTSKARYNGAKYGDPAHEDPHYNLGGYVIGRWRDPTVCRCTFYVIGASPGAAPHVWVRTIRRGSEHSLSGQALRDTVYGESDRKSKVLAMITSLVSLEAKEDRTTWVFTTTRLSGSDERVLEITIVRTAKPQRDKVAAAADIQFGPGAVLVL